MIAAALVAGILVFALVSAVFLTSASASLFHPLAWYLIFHGAVFVLRPVLVHVFGFDNVWLFIGFWPDAGQFVFTLLVANVALIVFAIVCMTAGWAEPSFEGRAEAQFDTAEVVAFLITLAALGPLAIYSATLRQEGASFDAVGAVQMAFDPTTGQPVYVNTTGYLAEAHGMGLPLTLGLIWIGRFRLVSFLPFLAFVAYRAYLGWGRWAIVFAVAGLALLLLVRAGRRWPKPWLALAVAPMLALFHVLGQNRGWVRGWVEGGAAAPPPLDAGPGGGGFVQSLANQDLANFDFLAFVLWVVPGQSRTHTWFTQYLQLFTEPIPRLLWPDKPVGAPIKWVSLHEFGNFANLTTSLAGDGWMSGGWLGLVVTMAVVAFALGRLHRWFWRSGIASRGGVLIYCAFLPLSLQWYRDGGISIFKFAFFALAPIVMWMLLTRLLRPRALSARVAWPS